MYLLNIFNLTFQSIIDEERLRKLKGRNSLIFPSRLTSCCGEHMKKTRSGTSKIRRRKRNGDGNVSDVKMMRIVLR